MRTTQWLGIAFATFAVWLATGCASEPEKATIESAPKMMAGEAVRVTATVEAVDKDNRILALRDASGELRTMMVTPAVKNFEQIKRGDRVTAEYLEQVAVYIEAPGVTSKDESFSGMAVMPPGSKPSGAWVDTVQRRAKVEAIDYESRVVSLRGQDGSVRTIRVSPRLGSIDKISKGDEILIRYTQTVAIGVAKTAPTP